MGESENKKLLEKIEKGIDLVETSELEEAVSLLRLCEDRVDLSENTDSDTKLLLYHNLALCYQLINDFEECGRYLKKTLNLAKNRDVKQEIEKIRNSRYVSMLHIQYSAILSHLGDHKSSVTYSKRSFNFISQCFSLCIHGSHVALPEYQRQNVKNLESCLSYLSGKLQNLSLSTWKVIQRTSLGVIHFTDWIFSFALNEILDIKPLRYFELKNSHTYLAEVSKDFMLEKICLIVSSCYLIATESRLLDDPSEVKKARNWHFKAVEIGRALLPVESPIYQHIINSYEKHYPVELQKVKPKSKTPVKVSRVSKSKTPVRPKGVQRKIIKDFEIKTERTFVKEKVENQLEKFKTQREIREPEPQISEDLSGEVNNTFIINSNELYGIYEDD